MNTNPISQLGIPVDFIFVEVANFQMELAKLCHILVPRAGLAF